ncbi:MAG: bacillithiol biosynthesis deacetylase BshB1 [Gemmatimonadetes bacterium]|nr:bacillithiol biosynthesis deacetylase BshB1 [Gemmatimonadota bacterium]MYG86354.1 bacillithiol biosynthesis deacetylase BshB1 [Gemmatimonadota bacterium]MYJ91198.1 bacillithiol biosynthesis deacetylase BshB1 [Gemmatimonadota bacterium]
MKLDVLAVSPHPDDVELHCGGLMIRFADLGYATGIVDMSLGEMGTRGTVDGRKEEAAAAAEVLGLSERLNLELPDARVSSCPTHRDVLIDSIRRYRPDMLLVPHEIARHPDHGATARLATDAAFLAGLEKVETDHPSFRPRKVVFYLTHHRYREPRPSFIVDITTTFSRKIDAVKAHRSQFHDPESTEPETFISRPEFLDEVEAQSRYYGQLIGARYGEPFVVREYLSIDDPLAHFTGEGCNQ